ncbi:DUF6355 family natural product biosynthesis protein [Actinosynnema sp. CS-041913]|uniref:DUF6355 family natural product biosynthesis protein n=1 Tax=Actinosynnema sp. CS-041913 TaxID=3239917 RepID=UPI003D8E4023
MHHPTTARHALAVLPALAALLLTPADADATQALCGFHHVNPDHHNGAVALYTHCADSFILIRVENSGGHYGRCVGPRGSVPFWPSEQVSNAYYVPIAPDTMEVDGRRICRLQQPPV